MRKKVTKDQWEALIHWNFALVGGFLGAYAILLHMGNFGSAQTGNIMEMAASLVSGEWYDVLLRVLALPLFGGGVVVSYLLTNYTNINMRKLAILVISGILITAVKTSAGWSVSDFFLFCISVGRIFIGKRLQQCDHLFQ